MIEIVLHLILLCGIISVCLLIIFNLYKLIDNDINKKDKRKSWLEKYRQKWNLKK